MKFHHHGLAVRNPDPAREWLIRLGYTLSDIIYDPLQYVSLQLAKREDTPMIELVWSEEDKSPLKRWLKNDPTAIYHTCYEVESIKDTIRMLRSSGRAIPIGHPQPAVLFGGRYIQFLHLEGFGLIELIE
jgi:methylmalonyl-CoA/ethylmalonyl-CoA epimerase